MRWLGIDVETNKLGVWNVGVALFKKRQTLAAINVFIEETFTEKEELTFGGAYLKTRDSLCRMHNPVWVQTREQADSLVWAWIKGMGGFSRSFGYNSSTFDLGVLRKEGLYVTSRLLDTKPHLDLMPLVLTALVGRKSFHSYWKANVLLGNTAEGNAEYVKYSAELVLNYIAHTRYKAQGKTWVWKKEKHVGVEDLVEFEYPILHYFVRILKKGTRTTVQPKPFLKWADV